MRRELATGLMIALVMGVVLGAMALHHVLKIRLHDAYLGQLEGTVDVSLRVLERGLAAGLTLQSSQLLAQAMNTSGIQSLGHVGLSIVSERGLVIASNRAGEPHRHGDEQAARDPATRYLVVERDITTAFGSKAARLVGELDLDEVRDDQVKLVNRVLATAGGVWLAGVALIGLICWRVPSIAFARAGEVERSLKDLRRALELGPGVDEAKPVPERLRSMFARVHALNAQLRRDAWRLNRLDEEA